MHLNILIYWVYPWFLAQLICFEHNKQQGITYLKIPSKEMPLIDFAMTGERKNYEVIFISESRYLYHFKFCWNINIKSYKTQPQAKPSNELQHSAKTYIRTIHDLKLDLIMFLS
jgi:hypothetical protein